MDEFEFQSTLQDTLFEADDWVDVTETFEEAGVMTSNKGLVVRTTDGSEFQVTIVKSK